MVKAAALLSTLLQCEYYGMLIIAFIVLIPI